MTIDFQDIQVTRPEIQAEKAAYDAIAEKFRSDDFSEVLVGIEQWEQRRRTAEDYRALSELKFEQNTQDEAFEKEMNACNELVPQLTELDVDLKRQLLSGPHADSLKEKFGDQLLAIWQSNIMAFEPSIKDDLAEELNLSQSYNKLLASAELEFEGKTYNLEGIHKFSFDADRNRRYSSAKVKWEWFSQNQQELDEFFDKLVQLRDQMAKKVNRANYIELGYLNMCRVDYDQNDVEVFRNSVRENVVPICQKLIQQKGKRIGVDKVMFWDESVHHVDGNPAPHGDHDWMIEKAKMMFDQMGHGLGTFFHKMHDGDFLDLKNREGKAGGGFCTSFPTHGMPFVFANFNGTAEDVRVFTHEIGHAFQCYESRNQPVSEYLWPTYEACEVHSMGLEFLTYPYMHLFFEDETDRFIQDHLSDAITFLPYGVAVDHFQHLVYENPASSPTDRFEMWRQMESLYMPWRDYGDLKQPKEGGRWQLQRHIYMHPFYYIDYALAQTCALQFWIQASKDRESTMSNYAELCQRGGESSFQGLVKSAGLLSPFDPSVLRSVAEKANETLKSIKS